MAKKAKSLVGKSLYDVIVTKSRKFVEKMKAPLIKKSLKREFAQNVTAAVTEIYESKAREIELLMEVKNIDVEAILAESKTRKEIFADIVGMWEIYTNIFGEDLEVEITEDELAVSTADILSAAVEIDEDDED